MDLPRLEREIVELEEQAAAPNLWDDPAAAQIVTSGLSHRQANVKRLRAVEARLRMTSRCSSNSRTGDGR